MIARRHGHIVAISSMIAFYPMSTAVAYTTSKYAVKGFMDCLHRESIHENWGIKTLTVFPHVTNTRKEIIDFLKRKVRYVRIGRLKNTISLFFNESFSATTIERVRFRSPSEVGAETVYALRRGVGYVAVPRYSLLVGKFFQ